MIDAYLEIQQSAALSGVSTLSGAKNAVLVTMASLLLTSGKSRLTNVPASADVLQMIKLLEQLGATVDFDEQNNMLLVDTTMVNKWVVHGSIMKKMRASILVMGPLLARFGRADVAVPGGCSIGQRPIDYHLNTFAKMGVTIESEQDFLKAHTTKLRSGTFVFEYPSVGATENIMMAATLAPGLTRLINAALEPEVLDLIVVLNKMGARISIKAPATIEIEGVTDLVPVEHAVIPDRLEAGSLLLAAAITGGDIYLPEINASMLDVFLLKLEQMGHSIEVGLNGQGIRLRATDAPRAVSFKTGPFPGFPTDLQAPMMVAQCLADGQSIIEETVFENRLVHVRELTKMGAQITVEHNKAIVTGVDELFGTHVIASDIRSSCALVLAGFIAHGSTVVTGVQHWRRGYEALENKLAALGGSIVYKDMQVQEKAGLSLDGITLARKVNTGTAV
jgi:UDP-N-acetylglucosamine 1-carboxyvinyltransferase